MSKTINPGEYLMRDMIRYVPSREEAYFTMPEQNSFFKDFINSLLLIAAVILFFSAAVPFAKKVWHRVLYQWQVECLQENKNGYGKTKCDFWHGARP